MAKTEQKAAAAKPTKCPTCGRDFKSYLAMKIHMGQTHGKKKPAARPAAKTPDPEVAVVIHTVASKLPEAIRRLAQPGREVTVHVLP